MSGIERRSLMRFAMATIPVVLTRNAAVAEPAAHATRVAAGTDRENKAHAVGVSHTTYKVLTRETGGALFVMEQGNQKKGGPSRHIHHGEDEVFYAMEGEYIVEVGGETVHLHAGDCVLGPRGIPHSWAFVGNTPGRLLLSYAPAGKMEAFFNELERLAGPGAYSSSIPNGAELMRAYGMERVGPPLAIG